jgi:hypothetical protein
MLVSRSAHRYGADRASRFERCAFTSQFPFEERRIMKSVASIAALVAAASLSSTLVAGTSAVVIDGQADAAYGKPIVVQNTQTNFGNSNIGLIDFANGSELNAGFGLISTDDGFLYLVLAGNLESNFNKFELFLDFKKGGQNKLRGDNPDVDFNGLNRMGDNGSGNGLVFDAAFSADYYVTATGGNNPYSLFANSAQILTNGGGSGGFLGSGGAGTSILVGGNGILIGIDNSNTAGVDGGTGLASGAGVTTGIELAIPLSLLEGWDGGDIKVCAFINGGGHDFVSNQVIGGIGGGGNLGEPRFVNFDFVGGDQFFVVEAPAAPVLGDLDGDGSVNGADLAILLGSWGPCKGCSADFNGDNVVDGADLAVLLGAWG